MNRRQKILFRLFSILFLSAILAACNDAVDSPYPAVSFDPKSTMSSTGRSSAVSFVIADKAYVALGRSGTRSAALNDCWEYNPVTDSWREMEPFPGKKRVNAIAEVVAGKAYVGLGFDLDYGFYRDEAFLKDFWSFDPASNSWTRKADFPNKNTNACISFVANGAIYAGFGFDGWAFKNDLWKYNIADDRWEQMAETGVHARTGAVACASGEHVYIGTGYHTTSENDWWEYFPSNDTWKKLKNMPDKGREFGVSLSVDNRFFVATGRYFHGNLTGGHLKADLFEYDAMRNVWYERGTLPGGGRENAVAFVVGGKAYIGFGENDQGMLNDLWSFTP